MSTLHKPCAKLSPARRTALKVFAECRRREARARDLMRGSEAMAKLDPRDRALVTRLVLGTVAARGELDHVITSHLRAKSKLEPLVRDALRIAAFEVLYMDTPTQVAVSQGVELARSASPRAAGLANAVLHRVADEDAATLAAACERVAAGNVDVYDLQRVGGLPEWLAARILEDLGPAEAGEFAARALEPAGSAVAANLAKHTAGDCEALLREAGCEPEEGPVPGSWLLGKTTALAASGLVEACDVLPCDLAAQEVVACAVNAAQLKAGKRVLEVGQGRGTKSILLAASGAEVTSVEVDPRKSELAERRMVAAGVADRVTCVCDDGRELGKLEPGTSYDLVFVDAPCSGTGTLARHAEIAWSLDPAAPSELANLQLAILRRAATRVAPGGVLAYSTCSILREEDRSVFDAFLSTPEGNGFTLVSAALTNRPHSDRHFLAVLRRES